MVRGDDHSGCTAIGCLVTPDNIICANAGDSRSILIRSGLAVEMSEDHKPDNAGEKTRIFAAGGTVSAHRVNGDLAVSRALGDFVYKHRTDLRAEEQQVSAEPEFKTVTRTPDDQVRKITRAEGGWRIR
jgi:serine/threonine protein phosphatase PrpC